MKKVLIGVAVFVIALGAAAFLYREQIGMMLAFSRLKPTMSFAEAQPPGAPDYAQQQSWAALPDREDAADVVAEGDALGRTHPAPTIEVARTMNRSWRMA